MSHGTYMYRHMSVLQILVSGCIFSCNTLQQNVTSPIIIPGYILTCNTLQHTVTDHFVTDPHSGIHFDVGEEEAVRNFHRTVRNVGRMEQVSSF